MNIRQFKFDIKYSKLKHYDINVAGNNPKGRTRGKVVTEKSYVLI